MSDVAKVIRLHDVAFEARHNRPSRVWPVGEPAALTPVTSLTDRLAEAEARQPKSLGELIRGP